MTTARAGPSATLLPNGTVLIFGGNASDRNGTSAEIYDPATGTFTLTGSMATATTREGTATLLQSGKVLTAGGGIFVAELFDPDTGTFSLTGSMEISRSLHTATLVPNGDVLVTGGVGSEFPGGGVGELGSAEIYH